MDTVEQQDGVAIRNVSLSYQSGKPVVEGIDICIPAEQFVALVGPSGCGKTSLLSLIGGLISPSTGRVEVSGESAHCPNPTVGYMFARDNLLPWRRARTNIELALEGRMSYSKKERRKRAEELLELVGLGSVSAAYPHELSHGMRQRVALARTLAPEPAILLMDEPFAALDARTRLTLQREFLRLWELENTKQRALIVFVTHDLTEAVLLADRVLVMLPGPGRIVHDRVVDIPRPRSESLREIMFSEEFRAQQIELFDLLEGSK